MTKSELIQAVAQRLPHLSTRDVEIVVNTVFGSVTGALQRGDRIEIRGFGSFSVRHRRARQGRNPKSGESIDVPSKRVPFFTVGHELRARVDGGHTTAVAPEPEWEPGSQATGA
ncbi:MAG: integration host factor subunit beta [Myxococcota bacterium]